MFLKIIVGSRPHKTRRIFVLQWRLRYAVGQLRYSAVLIYNKTVFVYGQKLTCQLDHLPPTEFVEIRCVTPWCRILIEKLTGLQLVTKFPAFHGTRRFITALTTVRLPSLSWASPIQSIYPHLTSWRSILILSIHLQIQCVRLSEFQFLNNLE